MHHIALVRRNFHFQLLSTQPVVIGNWKNKPLRSWECRCLKEPTILRKDPMKLWGNIIRASEAIHSFIYLRQSIFFPVIPSPRIFSIFLLTSLLCDTNLLCFTEPLSDMCDYKSIWPCRGHLLVSCSISWLFRVKHFGLVYSCRLLLLIEKITETKKLNKIV